MTCPFQDIWLDVLWWDCKDWGTWVRSVVCGVFTNWVRYGRIKVILVFNSFPVGPLNIVPSGMMTKKIRKNLCYPWFLWNFQESVTIYLANHLPNLSRELSMCVTWRRFLNKRVRLQNGGCREANSSCNKQCRGGFKSCFNRRKWSWRNYKWWRKWIGQRTGEWKRQIEVK